jgi:HAD superfamily hydrolase (TIGR01450 family)
VPLWDRYDLTMLDLDGVVYIGPVAVEGAARFLARAARAGMSHAYVTNNAARPPAMVAEHLRELGIPAQPGDVVTSAQAAARLVSESVPAGAPVFVIGGLGLFEALTDLGLKPVQSIADGARAVVSGYHPDLLWKTVVQGAILVARGLPWVASNTDLTLPTVHGVGPGNGVLVGAVAGFAGREPVVAGKPMPPLFEETRIRVGGERPLVVGDRLDTDIAGAHNAGLDSLLVMTGVTRLAELIAATPGLRPSFISTDLSGLGLAQPLPAAQDAGSFELGGWTASIHGGQLQVAGSGDRDDWWRVVASAAWRHLDSTGQPVGTTELAIPASVAPDRRSDA